MAENRADIVERVRKQRAEFEAAELYAVQLRRVLMTAVVDDDYPEVRADYEHALHVLLEKLWLNGRRWPTGLSK